MGKYKFKFILMPNNLASGLLQTLERMNKENKQIELI